MNRISSAVLNQGANMKYQSLLKRKMTARELEKRKEIAKEAFLEAIAARWSFSRQHNRFSLRERSKVSVSVVFAQGQFLNDSIFRCVYHDSFGGMSDFEHDEEAIVTICRHRDSREYDGIIELLGYLYKGCWYRLKDTFVVTKDPRNKLFSRCEQRGW